MQEKYRCDVGGSSFSAAASQGPNLLLLEGPPRGVGHAHVLIVDSDVVSTWGHPGGASQSFLLCAFVPCSHLPLQKKRTCSSL